MLRPRGIWVKWMRERRCSEVISPSAKDCLDALALSFYSKAETPVIPFPVGGRLIPSSRYARLRKTLVGHRRRRGGSLILPGEGDLLVFMPIPIAQLYAILLYILHVHNPIVQSSHIDLALSVSIRNEVYLPRRTSRWACGRCDRLSFEVDQAVHAGRRGT